jgi:FKBP-type peptidyl-prolyl cis-trans isomerase SlyD
MKAQVISFHCVLKDQMGKVISSTLNRDVLTAQPGGSCFLKGLADGLCDLAKGERRSIQVRAEQAYGFYNPELVRRVRRRDLPQGPHPVGATVCKRLSGSEVVAYRVIAADQEFVTLDGNHPLAGQDLVFDIETLEARDATADEVTESLVDSAPVHWTRQIHFH